MMTIILSSQQMTLKSAVLNGGFTSHNLGEIDRHCKAERRQRD